MIRNFLIVAVRHLRQRPAFSVIKIFVLSLGLASFIFIYDFISYEMSFDTFHQKLNNIYRVQQTRSLAGTTVESALSCSAAGPALKEEIPGIVDFVRLHKQKGLVTSFNKRGELFGFMEEKIFFVDTSFFNVFSFELISGKPENFFAFPNSIILSEEASAKYFDEENPIGKTILINRKEYTISGKFKNFPENSHFTADFLIPYQALLSRRNEFKNYDWYWDEVYTYVLLDRGIDPSNIAKKFPSIIEKHIKGTKTVNEKMFFTLQPLEKIHLFSNLQSELEINGNWEEVYILVLIGCIILFISLINFSNMLSISLIDRFKEIGVRKSFGIPTHLIVYQLAWELLLITLAALMLAILLVVVILPFYNYFVEADLSLNILIQTDTFLIFISYLIVCIVVFGFQSILVIKSLNLTQILRGVAEIPKHGLSFKNFSIFFQFIAALIMLGSTIVVYRQINYLLSKDLGIDLKETLVIPAPVVKDTAFVANLKYFKAEVLKNPDVAGITSTTFIPGKEIEMKEVAKRPVEIGGELKQFNFVGIDEDFLSLFRIELILGRSFNSQEENGSKVVLNESALKALEFKSAKDAIGKEIIWSMQRYEIIGVIRDYHQRSLKYNNEPTIYYNFPSFNSFFCLKLSQGSENKFKQDISSISDIWTRSFPKSDFQYFFLEDYFNTQYKSEKVFSKVFLLFTLISLVMASLGLYAVSAITISQRTKEIAIRKVLGAKLENIFWILSKKYIYIVIVANIVAAPIIYMIMKSWLQSYTYSISFNFLYLLVPGAILFSIVFLTIGSKVYKISQGIIVKFLRIE